MLHLALLCLLSCFSISSFCQKKLIDVTTPGSWIKLKQLDNNVSSIITNDGKYLAFKFENGDDDNRLCLQSIDKKYKKTFPGIQSARFTNDSRHLILDSDKNSVAIYNISTSKIEYIPEVESFELSTGKNNQWIACVKQNFTQELLLRNINNRKQRFFKNVSDFKFCGDGNTMAINVDTALIILDLVNDTIRTTFYCPKISQLALTQSGSMLAFIGLSNNKRAIFIYETNSNIVNQIINNKTNGFENDLEIVDRELDFTPDESKIFFYMDSINFSSYEREIPQSYNILNYTDQFIKHTFKLSSSNCMVSSLIQPNIIKVAERSETVYNFNYNNYILTYSDVNRDEYYWNKEKMYLNIVNLSTGQKTAIIHIPKGVYFPFPTFELSPSENFLIWFDARDKYYYSLEISSKRTYNLTKNISEKFYDDESDIVNRRQPYGIVGFPKNKDKVLLYDKFDIWELDLGNQKPPRNITKFWGRNSGTRIRNIELNADKCLPPEILISAFNGETKTNAITIFNTAKEFNPSSIKLTNDVYYGNLFNSSRGNDVSSDIVQKARNKDVYITRRMNTSSSPNLFMTKDFKTYIPLSNIHPEKDYNWMTSELIKWTLPDGRLSKGIIYKPENFDSTKKYPIIFNYYEKRSDELNIFKMPDLSDGDLNIPLYVSNGYLVCVPDMQYETGNVASSITMTMTSLMTEIKKCPYIDTLNMGLQGFSFGGYETLVLIGKTHIFKAAQVSSGVSNLTNGYFQIIGDITRQNFYEYDQINIGNTIWESPNLFIKNSPIFFANDIQTPLLLLHNDGDEIVDVAEANSMYSALRRLNKPAWFLNYHAENHEIQDKYNKMDFTVKQRQFFDYYLKNKVRPDWMK